MDLVKLDFQEWAARIAVAKRAVFGLFFKKKGQKRKAPPLVVVVGSGPNGQSEGLPTDPKTAQEITFLLSGRFDINYQIVKVN